MPFKGHIKKCVNPLVSALLIFFLLPAAARSATDRADLDRIAAHTTWQHLVFFKKGIPEVSSHGFYLADKDSLSAHSELAATLEVFASDDVAKCKYPARYYWLSTQLDHDYLQRGLADCSSIPGSENRFSLLLVGGYLKNPVSSFGHLLATLRPDDSSYLLADSYNFGAKVPAEDNFLAYAYKGVFGAYPSSFSRLDHFLHDKLYSQLENRDIWEYELDLTKNEAALLAYHMYEMAQHDFDYYFFKQNCAYRTGELLELLDGIQVTDRSTPWYSPEYVAHQLVEFNEKSGRKIIKSETFHPAAQTKTNILFERLRPIAQQKVNKVIAGADISTLEVLSNSEHRKALDFLLEHTDLKHRENPAKHYEDLKRHLVKVRITLPAEETPDAEDIIHKISPAQGPKPNKFEVLLSERPGFRFSMYQRDPLNEATDLSMEFRTLEVFYQPLANGKENLNVDFIKLRKFENLTHTIHGERKWSWELKAAAHNDYFDIGHMQTFAQGGVGAAYGGSDSWLAYQLFGLALHDRDHAHDLKSNTGILLKQDSFSAQLEYEKNYRKGDHVDVLTFTVRKRLEKNSDIRLHWRKQGSFDGQASLGLSWYW